MKKPRPHNPDNLTKKQVGRAPWRLLDEDEIKNRTRAYDVIEGWFFTGWECRCNGDSLSYTYRTRLSRAQLRRLK